jgi:ribonuclease Z
MVFRLNESQVIYETRKFTVTSFPVEHRIPCVGFLFEEKQFPVSIDKEKLTKDVTLAEIGSLKARRRRFRRQR